MNLRLNLPALAFAASLLTSLTAVAQEPSEGSTDGASSEGSTDPVPSEAPSDEAPSAASAGPTPLAEPSDEAPSGAPAVEAKSTASLPASNEPAKSTEPAAPTSYVGFVPPIPRPRIETKYLTLQIGMIAHPQFEIVGAPDATSTTKNIYLRRVGLFVNGTVTDYFDYFFDVDYPNLFKVDPSNQTGGTSKNAPGLNVQDIIVTLKPLAGMAGFGNYLKFDAGFMLPALSHNAIQGAGTLYGWDYFVNAFRRSIITAADPFKSNGQSPQGRDAGVQLRGLLIGDHLEYRVGLFQGLRVGNLPASQTTPAEVGGVNFPRFTARLQANLLDPETEFFYQGTYLGAKKVLSFGGFVDFQDEYRSFGGDVFLDLPLGPGILTAQANVMYWNGGNFIQTLTEHLAIMAEAGYLIRSLMLSPIGRFERVVNQVISEAEPSEDRFGGGLAFWPFGHNSNFKAFYTFVNRVPAPDAFHQVNVQWQLYF